MHNLTAAELKRNKQSHAQNIPREGTKIRKVYDLFMGSKGKVIDFKVKQCGKCPRQGSRVISYLIDCYGLDIRRISNGKWCLVGEWFGKVYVDYVVNKDA